MLAANNVDWPDTLTNQSSDQIMGDIHAGCAFKLTIEALTPADPLPTATLIYSADFKIISGKASKIKLHITQS